MDKPTKNLLEENDLKNLKKKLQILVQIFLIIKNVKIINIC